MLALAPSSMKRLTTKRRPSSWTGWMCLASSCAATRVLSGRIPAASACSWRAHPAVEQHDGELGPGTAACGCSAHRGQRDRCLPRMNEVSLRPEAGVRCPDQRLPTPAAFFPPPHRARMRHAGRRDPAAGAFFPRANRTSSRARQSAMAGSCLKRLSGARQQAPVPPTRSSPCETPRRDHLADLPAVEVLVQVEDRVGPEVVRDATLRRPGVPWRTGPRAVFLVAPLAQEGHRARPPRSP